MKLVGRLEDVPWKFFNNILEKEIEFKGQKLIYENLGFT